MARAQATGRVASTRTNSILPNGTFESAPTGFTAQTNTAGRWIDGSAAGSAASTGLGWATPNAGSGVGANAAASFDNTISRSGTTSMKLSNLTITGGVTAGTYNTTVVRAYYPIQVATAYILSGYIRTNNVPANGAFIDIRQYSANGTTLATTSTTKVGGTDASFRQVTLAFTSNASAVFYNIFLRNTTTGNVCDAWFDDITLVPATTGRIAASGRVAA